MTDASLSLAGKRVVVIGGGSGIGFAAAELAHGLGAEVVIASSQAATIDAAVGQSRSTNHLTTLRAWRQFRSTPIR